MDFVLFENFNTTNQTSPHFAKHLNFAKPVVQERCEKILLLKEGKRCDYARHSEACRSRYMFLNYNEFFYCWCDKSNLLSLLCIIMLLIWSALIFWILFFITNNYFVPALTSLMKTLKLNEYIAGLTIMTVGSTAPDIFGGILSRSSESRHIYTDNMSVSLFKSIFSSSCIMWVTPFAIDGTFFLRDVGYVLLSVAYLDFSIKFSEGFISLAQAVSMSLICPIYILIIIFDQYLQYRKNKNLNIDPSTSSTDSINFDKQSIASGSHRLKGSKGFNFTVDSPNKKLFRQFFRVFDTLDREDFNSKWIIFKLWALIKVVPLIIIRLFIPQMNFNKCSYSWSKLLCCIQITLEPSVVILYIYSQLKIVSQFVTACIIGSCLLCFVPLSIWAFNSSHTDYLPSWHKYIAILNITGCLLLLHMVTTQLIALLETLGISLHCSDNFIGCTLFTWGSGLSSLMANLTMARNGFPRMAYSSCFGAIIFSTFFSVSLPILINVLTKEPGTYQITEGTIGETCSIMLIISLNLTILYGITTNFMLRRSGALLGITIYALFIIFSVFSEFEIIHAFGADHGLDRSKFDESFAR